MSLAPTREEQAFGAGYRQASESGGAIIDHLGQRLRAVEAERDDLREALAGVKSALRFYADPFAWKKLNDPGNDVQVPDFYSETSFGDTALAALSTTERG